MKGYLVFRVNRDGSLMKASPTPLGNMTKAREFINEVRNFAFEEFVILKAY